jgi:hypothetical protein
MASSTSVPTSSIFDTKRFQRMVGLVASNVMGDLDHLTPGLVIKVMLQGSMWFCC